MSFSLPLSLLATRNLAKVLQKKAEYPVFGQTQPNFLRKCNRESCSSVERLSSGSVQPVVSSSARFHGFVCPSNLGEYSLVRLLFFQNLHLVFGYGLQCLGPGELSSNILVSENCDLFYTISFAGF